MFSVALIGPDGAGKTTVANQLPDTLPVPVRYIYMGINRDSSNHMLPTTRIVRWIKRAAGAAPDNTGPRDPNSVDERPKGGLRRLAKSVKSGLSLVNRISDEWYRQALATYHCLRGRIVLFDRHYFSDYYAYDIAGANGHLPLSRRIHGLMLDRLYPKPDLVIYLDAPSEVLFARKGEGSVESLERRRQEYLQMRDLVNRFAVVDANRPPEEVIRDVSQHILDFYREQTKTPAT